ncbi:hypothetical protein MADA3029_340012 [Vibrio nigripulchritudo MADA3029]|nr:hypothetical protein VIBNIAM115_610011 [Vibrio nigripulchritudo AM115]CCN44289.1 hypothetical protein VIBNIFTn2_740021 [Vibrio nigripulchritudo FTn2]CCN46286.1 hypothetical protein VIBNIMADA3020_1260012 [Vibrio nigripulchritudo MADA3020]CCN52649.1 hypothetical protein VIBNIMADA3021_130027 [Vibrio nigripulchritudo MADA3021]CCN59068.1 hypothetical protein MADA3029_340012 [Vibrio nigripulchritudo MADA3029]CCN66970.1 hypothetical protein VIBNIPon4_660021 [Vibrio nigripulchritudo POn4]CCN74400.
MDRGSRWGGVRSNQSSTEGFPHLRLLGASHTNVIFCDLNLHINSKLITKV